MANINIYGTLFSNLSQNNEKVIVLGSQVYGNGVEAPDPTRDEETTGIFTDLELKQIGVAWTTNIVTGSQYDINRIFKLKINNIENNIRDNYVPYTGATKNVDLGGHTIKSGNITAGLVNSSQGFYLTNKSGASIPSIDTNSDVYLLTNCGGGYNCLQLKKLYTEIMFASGGSSGNSLIGHLNNLYNKVNHITNPLRFKGVINSGGKLPTSGVEVGDVWHFNTDVAPYYGGDEVVCTSVVKGVGGTGDEITWELLGQNITPIPDSKITFAELEKP